MTEMEPTNTYYHGTRTELESGDLIQPVTTLEAAERDQMTTHVGLTTSLDEAIWDAELAIGEGAGRVYIVEPTGEVRDASELVQREAPAHPSMSCFTRDPLRVIHEVKEFPLYHGTRASLSTGDLIEPGHSPNFGKKERTTTYVYLARTLDAAIWGAELAAGDGPGRIYIVEPTGPIEDDPNLTDRKFRGNPTKSFRSREPIRVKGEITNWQGHSPERLKAMKDGVARLERLGVEPIDD